jgi:hypothetical protein
VTDDEFLAAFEACALVRNEWTHAAHVRMAWLYATRTADPLPLVRAGIQKLNATFVRVPGAPPDARGLDGYHETITTAFVRVIASRVRPGESFTAFEARNPDLFDRTFPALLAHYSPARLYSAEAKAAFVPPDRAELPQPENFCVTTP